MNKQEQSLLTEAAHEITSLRQVNQRMNLRLQMFDDCMLLLKAQLPSTGMGMGEDVVYKIEKAIAASKMDEVQDGSLARPTVKDRQP